MWSWSGLLQWLSSADCETLGWWWADNGAGDCRRFRRFDACTVLALHLVSAHLLGFITYICTWAADFSYYSCTITLFTSHFDNRPISSITSPVSLILWMNSTSSVLSYRLCQLFLQQVSTFWRFWSQWSWSSRTGFLGKQVNDRGSPQQHGQWLSQGDRGVRKINSEWTFKIRAGGLSVSWVHE